MSSFDLVGEYRKLDHRHVVDACSFDGAWLVFKPTCNRTHDKSDESTSDFSIHHRDGRIVQLLRFGDVQLGCLSLQSSQHHHQRVG